jgi:hypothetical protein
MMKNIVSIILCSIVFSICISCSEDGIDDTGFGALTGTAVQSGNNEPLANVKITTTPASTTVFTDEEGKFEIPKLASGSYSVQADLSDYQTTFQATNIINGETSSVVFEMEVSTFNNKPPSKPELIYPINDSIVESLEVTFAWSSSDPDDDELTYSLELRNDLDSEVELFESLTDTTYIYSTLKLGAKYFWQVSVSDDINEPVLSAVQTFSVTSPPTGNRFLFVRNINGNNVIFSSDEDGNEFQLTSENTNSFRPRRNVSANRIAYLQTTGAQADIYTMKRDGTDKVKVTSSIRPNGFNLNEINIDWPENSDMIYFPNLDKLYSIRSNGQDLTSIYTTPDGSLVSEMAVSENSNLIVLKTNNLNGYNVSLITIDKNGNFLDTLISGLAGGVSGLDLSFNNDKIVYSYDITGSQNSNYRRFDSRIFTKLINSTATPEDISGDKPSGTNDLEPIFSPNEASVIFTNTSNDGISPRNINMKDIAAGDNRSFLFENAFMPDWE